MINYDYYLMAKAGVVDQRKNEFNLEYDKARNKNTVVAKWIDDLRVESNSIQRELVQNGLDNFKREWDNTYELDSGIDTGQAFDLTVANCFPELSTEQIRLISQVDALIDIMEFIESTRIYNNQDSFNNSRPINKYWIGTEETEFVQLIYALIEADRLISKDKIKMTQAIADFLGFPLSNDWQSKLSHSIHQGNFDKKPRIFGDLDKAWEKYKDRQINKKLNL
jgi:hypothetical protein